MGLGRINISLYWGLQAKQSTLFNQRFGYTSVETQKESHLSHSEYRWFASQASETRWLFVLQYPWKCQRIALW